MSFVLLVPCYNAARFLPRLRQQVDRLDPAFDEVLLADDASTDGTALLAEKLGFRLLQLPRNLGPGGARNALARAATAEWIHFHDVDDEIAPNYLTRLQTAALEKYDAIFHWVDFIGEETRDLIIRWQFDGPAFDRAPAVTLLHRPMPTMSSLLRRTTFLAVGGFNEEHRCFEDGDLHFRIAAAGARTRCIPEILEWSLRHQQGAGSNQRYCFKCRLAFLEDYAARFPRLQAEIAIEAELTASRLALMGEVHATKQAIALCHRLGRHPPTTAHPALRLLKAFVPSHVLLQWQAKRRRASGT